MRKRLCVPGTARRFPVHNSLILPFYGSSVPHLAIDFHTCRASCACKRDVPLIVRRPEAILIVSKGKACNFKTVLRRILLFLMFFTGFTFPMALHQRRDPFITPNHPLGSGRPLCDFSREHSRPEIDGKHFCQLLAVLFEFSGQSGMFLPQTLAFGPHIGQAGKPIVSGWVIHNPSLFQT